MAPNERYARVSDDETENIGMISSATTTRTPEWADNAEKNEKNPWWKYFAVAGVFFALLIPSVSYTSSVMLENRVAQAVQEAQATRVSNISLPASTSGTPAPVKVANNRIYVPLDEEEITGKPLLLSNGTTILAGNPMAGKTFEIHDCGHNADEARAKGCAYDVMMQEWTSPECIDWTLAEKFLAAGNWTWFANPSASEVYDDIEIAKGNHDVVYVDQSYHRHHCIFTWERLVRAMRTQRPLVEKLVDYDHVMHCRMNTLKTFEEGAQPVRGVVAPTVFTKCASLDVWLTHLPGNKHSSVDRMLQMRDWHGKAMDMDPWDV
ncbi:hypothetical protein LTS08_001881 [Lithohypha guttulata]|nr:hypothetical protein LTS08_001881 [Lithohypha guttulata]